MYRYSRGRPLATSNGDGLLTVGEVAEDCGLTPSAVRCPNDATATVTP